MPESEPPKPPEKKSSVLVTSLKAVAIFVLGGIAVRTDPLDIFDRMNRATPAVETTAEFGPFAYPGVAELRESHILPTEVTFGDETPTDKPADVPAVTIGPDQEKEFHQAFVGAKYLARITVTNGGTETATNLRLNWLGSNVIRIERSGGKKEIKVFKAREPLGDLEAHDNIVLTVWSDTHYSAASPEIIRDQGTHLISFEHRDYRGYISLATVLGIGFLAMVTIISNNRRHEKYVQQVWKNVNELSEEACRLSEENTRLLNRREIIVQSEGHNISTSQAGPHDISVSGTKPIQFGP